MALLDHRPHALLRRQLEHVLDVGDAANGAACGLGTLGTSKFMYYVQRSPLKRTLVKFVSVEALLVFQLISFMVGTAVGDDAAFVGGVGCSVNVYSIVGVVSSGELSTTSGSSNVAS
jgi:hypothetical protein